METVSVSAKGQLVIPKALRRRVGLEQGGVVTVSVRDGQLVLEPVEEMGGGWRRWRGVLAGTDALAAHLREHRDEAARDA